MCVYVCVCGFLFVLPFVLSNTYTHTRLTRQQSNLVYRKMVKDVEKEEAEVSNTY